MVLKSEIEVAYKLQQDDLKVKKSFIERAGGIFGGNGAVGNRAR